ncbi:MAG: tRNA 2-thiocytidine(32) synthetase TtcA [Deltaproteobacteria bacterium]|nr:tRNA 2-thiocytidine(32) synthetase TtcA [Deltaproteobacteria bacterium]MBN2845304.1 tRNA 2-thiocytidine(32) synthetase TtcA [Deltaproteobacteria bacterium]
MEKKETKLYLHLKKWLEKAALDYGMIDEGDRVLVGVSGGLDSLVLLDLIRTPMLFLPSYSVLAVNIDLGFDEDYETYKALETYLNGGGYEYVMEKTDIGTFSHSDKNRKNPCFLCSRLRKKRIIEIAEDYGCNKIAFAHHKDDIIETLLLNMFYAREISTMVPNQSIFRGKFHIIRPLAYITEELVKKYAREQLFPTMENRCPTSRISKRMYIKNLLNELEKDNKDIRENIFKSMTHVKTEYLLTKEVVAVSGDNDRERTRKPSLVGGEIHNIEEISLDMERDGKVGEKEIL